MSNVVTNNYPLLYSPVSLSFFSFLRLSSILSHSTAAYDVYRHLCVGDVIFRPANAIVIIKWSITMQNKAKVATISLPLLGTSDLFPIIALRNMLTLLRQEHDFSLFQVLKSSCSCPLTESVARKHLKNFSYIIIAQSVDISLF